MNQDLRHSLRSLVDVGENGATPADAAARRALGRVGSARRRRPALIAGLTTVSLLSAGAAAALGYSLLQDDDAAPFPDRLTPETTIPSYEPVALTCGADVTDLVTTDGPLELGSESVDAANGSPVTLSTGAGASLSMYLRNASTEPVTIATTQGTGTYLVQDGRVVAMPAPATERPAVPADATLAPGDTRTLADDGLLACPDASGATPTSIPAGDYDAYGVVAVGIDGTADPLDVVGGPWPVRVEATIEPPAPVTLPAANPDAVFPECGAVVDARTGPQPIILTAPGASLPLGPTMRVDVSRRAYYTAEGLMGTTPYVVAVKDGVVVGSYSADPTPIPYVLYSDGGDGRDDPTTTATVPTTICSDHSTPLPQGRYSVWAAMDLTIASRGLWEPDQPSASEVVNEPFRALSEVATLWMDGAGQSSGHPGLTPGWPAALSHEAVFGPDRVQPESVVWLATSTQQYQYGEDASLIPSRDGLSDLGYVDTDVPFDCQVGLEAIGVEAADRETRYGIAVMFASRAEAQQLVDLWEPLHGPVLGVVDGGVGEVHYWDEDYLNCK